ncbi:MAG TPA: CPBP family intramembrane glutamic endopeptidase [Ktedonobacterales bacterium]
MSEPLESAEPQIESSQTLPGVGLPTSLGDRVPWHALDAARGAIWTILPLFGIALAGLLSGGAPLPKAPLSRGADIASAVSAFVLVGLGEAIFLIAPLYYSRKGLGKEATLRERLSALGLRQPEGARPWLLTLAAYVVALALSFGYDAVVNALKLNAHTNADTLLATARVAPLTVMVTLAMGIIVAPFCEEIFFRGYFQPGLATALSALAASATATVVFAVAHFDLGSFVPLLLLGSVLAFVRWRTKSVWPGLALHAANNLTAAVLILLALRG